MYGIRETLCLHTILQCVTLNTQCTDQKRGIIAIVFRTNLQNHNPVPIHQFCFQGKPKVTNCNFPYTCIILVSVVFPFMVIRSFRMRMVSQRRDCDPLGQSVWWYRGLSKIWIRWIYLSMCCKEWWVNIYITNYTIYLGCNRLFDWSRDMVLQMIYHCTTDMVLATVIYQLKTWYTTLYSGILVKCNIVIFV